jgi:hypothetical protein
MGVTGNPEAIGQYGDMFRAIPREALPPEPLLGPDGPLSAGLAGVHNLKAFFAADFARAQDQGIVVAGDGLKQIAANLPDFDRKGANGIAQLFPAPPPVPGGGR